MSKHRRRKQATPTHSPPTHRHRQTRDCDTNGGHDVQTQKT
nr:MAG TPA: hypothetical protein [Microviridae sp.]